MTGTTSVPARPRFYRGQVLTDRDLTALVDWVRGRFALGRHWDGWGVVDGLDVTATAGGLGLQVGGGVAVAPDGQAIAVRAEDKLTADLTAASAAWADCGTAAAGTGDPIPVGPFTATPDRWAAFDLYLTAAEVGQEPKPVAECGDRRRCEDGRTREAGELHPVRVDWTTAGRPPAPAADPQPDPGLALLNSFRFPKPTCST